MNFIEDKERIVNRDEGWEAFRSVLAKRYSSLDIDKILEKHFLKSDPVISYGIIEFVIFENKICYHMFRRRNTTEYDILIRGFAQKNQLFELLCLLSEDERYRILNYSWSEIWNDYYTDHTDGSYSHLKDQSRRRFSEIKELLQAISTKIPCKIKNRPLVFSKGKSIQTEEGLDAALREAIEETKDDFSTGRLYFQTPIVQSYIGSNGKKYIVQYYVWQRDTIYSCKTKQLGNLQGDDVRIRNKTISHELESEEWIEIPIFKNKRDQWEYQHSIDPYIELGIYKRHFNTIMTIHNHVT